MQFTTAILSTLFLASSTLAFTPSFDGQVQPAFAPAAAPFVYSDAQHHAHVLAAREALSDAMDAYEDAEFVLAKRGQAVSSMSSCAVCMAQMTPSKIKMTPQIIGQDGRPIQMTARSICKHYGRC